MTRFTQDEVAQIITGVIKGQGPKGIAQRIGRKHPSVTNVILKLQKDKPLFQRILDGESVDAIAQKYVDDVTASYRAKSATGIEKRLGGNPPKSEQLNRIEVKLDELLALWKPVDKSPIEAYDAQGKRRSIFG